MSSLPIDLSPDSPVLLDGPTGTELERRGFPLTTPLWSASALEARPDLLLAIHRDYVDAGARILTANTFRTNPATLGTAGYGSDRARHLTRTALAIAREAAGTSDVLVAGALGPVGDCYQPHDSRSGQVLRQDHEAHVANLVDGGCDLILIETMNSLGEAMIAVEAALPSGLPLLLSFVTDRSGTTLLDGTDLQTAVSEVDRLHAKQIQGILVNCASPSATRRGVELIAEAYRQREGDWEFGGYPNSSDPDPIHGWDRVRTVPPDEFDREVIAILAAGARFIGSCCGTTPETIRRIRKILERNPK